MSIESQTTTTAATTTAAAQQKSHHVHVHKKRKTAYSTKSSKREAKLEYPADCNLSADNEKRSKFTPCDHEGPCGRGCPCVDDQVHCEKACACPLVRPPAVFSFEGEADFLYRIVRDDGGDVHVNVVKRVGYGLVNVLNGRENVMLIYVGVAELMKFLIQ